MIHSLSNRSLMRSVLGVTLLVCGSAAGARPWSFYSFLEGDWELERVRAGEVMRARYSLRSAGGEKLEGNYFEYPSGKAADDVAAPSNAQIVRVDFLDGERRGGSFSLAKSASDEPGALPTSEPLPAFDFEFSELRGGSVWFSESAWLGSGDGLLHFTVVGEDAFVITRATAAATPDVKGVKLTTWSATRSGIPRGGPTGRSSRKSLLQRWGWYLAPAILYCALRVLKTKAKAA